jgi:hypothetical protein
MFWTHWSNFIRNIGSDTRYGNGRQKRTTVDSSNLLEWIEIGNDFSKHLVAPPGSQTCRLLLSLSLSPQPLPLPIETVAPVVALNCACPLGPTSPLAIALACAFISACPSPSKSLPQIANDLNKLCDPNDGYPPIRFLNLGPA